MAALERFLTQRMVLTNRCLNCPYEHCMGVYHPIPGYWSCPAFGPLHNLDIQDIQQQWKGAK